MQKTDIVLEKLLIYMNAAHLIFRAYDKKVKQIDTVICSSKHVIGAMLSEGDIDSPNV